MRTIQAGEKAVSIWFSGETPPGKRQTLGLVHRALAEQGYAPWPETVLELFTAGGDALVIARPGRMIRQAFRFASLEHLLTAAGSIPEDGGDLYRDGRGYTLIPPEGQGTRYALYEFGTPVTLSRDWEHHAREQGLCLLSGEALAGLRRFSEMGSKDRGGIC